MCMAYLHSNIYVSLGSGTIMVISTNMEGKGDGDKSGSHHLASKSSSLDPEPDRHKKHKRSSSRGASRSSSSAPNQPKVCGVDFTLSIFYDILSAILTLGVDQVLFDMKGSERTYVIIPTPSRNEIITVNEGGSCFLWDTVNLKVLSSLHM